MRKTMWVRDSWTRVLALSSLGLLGACTNRVTLQSYSSLSDAAVTDVDERPDAGFDASTDASVLSPDAGPPPYTGFETHMIDPDDATGGLSIALAVDGLGRDHFAWRDTNTGGMLYGLRDGDDIRLESISSEASNADVDLELDAAGEPHVSFARKADPDGETLVIAHRSGGAWYVDALSFSYDDILHTSLALTSEGKMLVAVNDDGRGSFIVTNISGEWTSLILTERPSSDPEVVVDQDDIAHVVYVADGIASYTRAMTADASSWTPAESVSARSALRVALALNSSGQPYVCFDSKPAFDTLVHCGLRASTWAMRQVATLDDDIILGDSLRVAFNDQDDAWASYYMYTARSLNYVNVSSAQLVDPITVVGPIGFNSTAMGFEPGGIPHFAGSYYVGAVVLYRGTPE